MKRIGLRIAMGLLSLPSTVSLFGMMLICIRFRLVIVGLLLYAAVPIILFVFSILRYGKRRGDLFLTYATSFLLVSLLFGTVFWALVIGAIRSFT